MFCLVVNFAAFVSILCLKSLVDKNFPRAPPALTNYIKNS